MVSEASDAAARGILHHCHAPRLVLQVCDILTKDKSAKLRKHCSGFLFQVGRLRTETRCMKSLAAWTAAEGYQSALPVSREHC